MRRLMSLLAVFLVVAAAAPANRPPVLEAARNGDRDALRALVQKGASPNAADPDGTTALHWASYRDDVESVTLLLRAGAKVNAANDLGATPLWTASQNGGERVVARLLEAGANPNAALVAGETPLMVAARSGYAPVASLLLAKGADVNARGARRQTALMWAVAQKHPGVVQLLLDHGADLRARSDTWSQVMAVSPHGYPPYNKDIPAGGETALMFAARVGDAASAKLLVARGADVNDTDAWGVSATSLAAHSGYLDLVELLLEHGANPNLSAPGFAPLHSAIMRRDEALVRTLLAHGADANAPLRTWTPTRRSSRDFNFAPELVGATPIWLAARFTEPGVIRLLVEHGADPRFVHRSEKVVEGRAGDPFQHRFEAATLVMAALGMGGGSEAWIERERSEREPLALDTVRLAVELGVDVNAANTDGRTALDAAQALEYHTVAAFLVAQGARPGVTKDGAAPRPKDKDDPRDPG